MKNIYWIIIGILMFTANLLAVNISGEEIMQHVKDRYDGDDGASDTEMILINKNGKQRVRKIRSRRKDFGKDSKKIMFFMKPADVKGTGFLSWEYDDKNKDDDRWLYMPALRKARRISGSSKNDYFMGSDFTYDDMGDRAVDEDNHLLIGSEIINNNECWKIKSTPLEDEYYKYRISYVRKDINMIIKVDYYGEIGLQKTLSVDNIKQINSIWTALTFSMNNFERKHKTIINVSNIKYNIGLKDDLFTVATIKRGRVK